MTTNQKRVLPQRQESNLSLAMSETSDTFSMQYGTTSAFDSGSSYVTDDESFNTSFDVASQSSFGVSHGQKIDDTSLALLIGKLKGSIIDAEEGAAPPAEADATSVGSSSTSDDMEDDAIASHLRALANCTTKGTSLRLSPAELDDDEASEDEDDEESDDEEDDEEEEEEELEEEQETKEDESDDEMDYAAVDEILKNLGVQHSDDQSVSSEDQRQQLETIALQGQTYDFDGAPTTTSSKTQWLSQLACDLLDEDSSSDDETVVTVNVNIDNLARVAQSAEKIISASRKQQEKMSTWRAQQRSKQVSFEKNTAIELDVYYEGMKGPAACAPSLLSVESKGNEQGSRDHSNDVDSVFTPVHKLVPGDNYGMPWAFALDDGSPADKPLEVVIKQSTNKRKQPRKQVPSGLPKPPSLYNQQKTNKNPRTRMPPRPPAAQKKRDSPSSALPTVDESSANDSIATKNGQKLDPAEDLGSKNTQEAAKTVIPKGYPPYPGFGAKWPWHPYSPDAPSGYRECYMHHMGEHYFKYMEFLRTKDDDPSQGKKQAEEIFRNSLAGEANFKSKKNKPKPAIAPSTFTSQPGKARKNCVVPVSMPKIEEGSNSSNSADLRRKIAQRAKQPAQVRVGKHHPKSKGRKGKIVVVSQADLKQKSKNARRETKVAPQSKAAQRKVAKASHNKGASAHSRSILSQEQAAPAATDQQCACTIM